jgi:hypothetical protein
MRAILSGLPYPETLLMSAIRRIRAEREVNYPRAALIKACINRKTRRDNPALKEELHVSLDLSNTNVGYRLGRLFAALEKVQGRSQSRTQRHHSRPLLWRGFFHAHHRFFQSAQAQQSSSLQDRKSWEGCEP